MKYLQPIAALNNQAGVLLEQGAYEHSLDILLEALVLTEESLFHDGDVGNDSIYTHEDVKSSSIQGDTMAMLSKMPLEELSMPRKKPISNPLEDDEINDTEFVYGTSIHITQNDMCEQNYVEPELNCIILFNMALGNHLLALEGTSSLSKRQQRLRKALKLYELTFSLQVDLGSMSVTSLIALVNNYATIYMLLEKTKRAEKFYNHMMSTLLAMIDIGEAAEVDQLDGFLRNASRLILQDVASPAA
jgi:tetratricopeptide (TPR) repeat protein